MIVYKVTNLKNGMIYIGQTSLTLRARKNRHYIDTKAEQNHKKKRLLFHDALNTYDPNDFLWEVLSSTENQKDADEMERYWISYYQADNPIYGYNQDSGGKSGGKKSQKTRDKIGKTTKDKWNNPDTASRMKDGLNKATAKWVEQSKNNWIDFVCPICGQVRKMKPYEAKIHKTCSYECSKQISRFSEKSLEAAERVKEKNKISKKLISKSVLEWAENNRELVLNCKYNCVSTGLQGLQEVTGLKDLRSLFLCFDGVKNKKQFLEYLKNYLQDSLRDENIC